MLLFAGLPIFFMELCLGQYTGQGPTKVFGLMAPMFQGLGFAMVACTAIVGMYYNVIMAWTLFYLFSGFQNPLPWLECSEANSIHCGKNETATSPAEDYFNYVMLGVDDSISWENYGPISWKLVLCVVGAWVLVCGALIKGIQSSGKVVYVTATFPYVILVALLIDGVMLDGAADGIIYYIKPDFSKLLDVQVWKAAAVQIFFSLSTSFGGLITLSSYNKFNNNCHRDAILVSFINCGTSVFAGFVVFSFVGYLAKFQGKAVADVIESGPALAFIAYPEAFGASPIPLLWSAMFFLMLLTLGLDSMFTFLETVVTAILDHFPALRAKKHYVVIGTSVAGVLIGLPMCCPGGIFLFTLLDYSAASWNILLFAIIEVILVAWIYGTDRFMRNIREMGMTLHPWMAFYWKLCWRFVTPALLIVIVVEQFLNPAKIAYGNYVFPWQVQIVGWAIGCATTALIPLTAMWKMFRQCCTKKCLGNLFQPSDKWGPAYASNKPKEVTAAE